jgi:hypothetical protein
MDRLEPGEQRATVLLEDRVHVRLLFGPQLQALGKSLVIPPSPRRANLQAR